MLMMMIHMDPMRGRNGWLSTGLRGMRHQAVRADAEEAPDPEEWRDFRAKLIAGGLRVTGEEKEEEDSESSEEGARAHVAPENEALLQTQSEELWNEYLQGAWAHLAPEPEAGGLLVRLPLQAQLVHEMRTDAGGFGGVLKERLIANIPTAGGAVDADAATDALPDAAAETDRLLEKWSSNTVFTYRLADRLIDEMLEAVRSQARDGSLDFSALEPEQQALIKMYADAQQTWQEVALVTRVDPLAEEVRGLRGEWLDDDEAPSSGRRFARESLVINRPLAVGAITPDLAQRLLNGPREKRPNGVPPLHEDAFVERFMKAFNENCAVYIGGPHGQDGVGQVIHGHPLPGNARFLIPVTHHSPASWHLALPSSLAQGPACFVI